MDSVRSCLACRAKAQKGALLRFVRSLDGEICFDEKGSLEHRGGYLCAQKTCLEKAFKKRMLFRTERTLPIDAEALMNQIRLCIKKSTLSRLGLVRRIGGIEMGKDAVLAMVSKNNAHVVITAKDFSARSLNDVVHTASKVATSVMQSGFSMDEFGHSLGRKKTGVVALAKSRITDEIVLGLNKLKDIE